MRDKLLGIGLATALLLGATPAIAQDVACGVDGDGDGTGDDCFVVKYGFSHPADRDFRQPFDDPFAYQPSDFEGSYIMVRSSNQLGAPGCGPARNFTAYLGQVLIREQNPEVCTPTSEFPTCDSGDRVGEECRLIGIADEGDCPGGGTCVPTGGCHVEIPLDLPGDENASSFASGLRATLLDIELMSSTSPSFSGTSDASDPTCLPENIRANPAQGWRFVLPASRGGGNGETYVRFHGDPQMGLYRHDDDSGLCCTSVSGGTCDAIGGYPEYPGLLRRTCALPDRIFRVLQTNDWIFDADAAHPPFGRFFTDPDHVIPGQRYGLCRANIATPCDVVADDPCPNLDASFDDGIQNPGEPGFVADECDLREPGFRNARPLNEDTDGDDIPDTPSPNCNTSPTFLRGTPNQYCTVIKQYAQPGEAGVPSGDPGDDCGVWNFGARPLPDDDCDGVDDRIGQLGDLCPFLNEYDPFADADGDCTDGDPNTPCRGDECECGDLDENGSVNIADILGTNDVIFDIGTPSRIGDANNDLTLNVEDILGQNAEVFVPNSAECRHVTRLGCGDGIVQQGEACDDGNVLNLDGCDTACQLE